MLTDFSTRLPKGVFNILAPCVEAGKADWIYFIKYCSDFICFANIFNRDMMENWVQHKKVAPGPNLSLGTLRKIIFNILEFCKTKPFLSGQK